MGLFVASAIDRVSPVSGGAGLRVVKAAHAFHNMGHEVVIFAPSDKKDLNGVKVYPLPYPTESKFQVLSIFTFNLRIFLTLIRFASKVDLFFVHNTTAAVSIFVLSRIFKKRFVLDVTDLHTEYLVARKRSIFEKFLTPCLRFVDYSIMRSADTVITVSMTMRDYLVSCGIEYEKIRVVYDGAEVDYYAGGKDSGADTGIIHLGTIDRQHGVEILIEAIPYILQECPDVKFYFVGGGRNLKEIIKMAERLNVSGNCIFTGTVPYHEVRRFLSSACIGIIPRPDNLANNQVVTVKLFEYWASGTAVVSSRLKGISEVAKDKHDIIFFEPGNSKELAEKTVFLFKNQETRKELQKNGMETVKGFDWKEIVKRIAGVSTNETGNI